MIKKHCSEARFKRSKGRPLKYHAFIAALEDQEIYSPATIVNHGESLGLFDLGLRQEKYKRERIKIRHALARFSQNHDFPPEGDGMVQIPGQAPIRGWTGQRWKDAVKQKLKQKS